MGSTGNHRYTITVDNTVKLDSSVDQLKDFFPNAPDLLPKYLPKVYKNITKFSQSQGLYTFKVDYADGCPIKTETVQIDKLDLEKLKCIYSVIDGDVLQYYKNLKVTVTLYPHDNGCKVERVYAYDKEDNSLSPAFFEFEIANLILVDQVIQNPPKIKY